MLTTKKYIKLDFYVNSAFKVATGQQSVIMNYITPIDAGLPGSCKVTKPLYAKKFSRNGFDIIMEVGPMNVLCLTKLMRNRFKCIRTHKLTHDTL